MKRLISICLLVLAFPVAGCFSEKDDENQVLTSASGKYVSIEKKDTHYNVIIDYRTGASRYDAGKDYGEVIHRIIPGFESIVDSCLKEFDEIGKLEANLENAIPGFIAEENDYASMIANVLKIKPQIPQEYRDEIDGLASTMSGGETDVAGDGKLSKNEVYILSILPDVIRAVQCNGLGVWGSMSSTGKNMVGRTLDFYSGTQGQFAQTHAVITVKNNSNSICFIGFVGNFGATTVFNEDGVFAAVLDSPVRVANSFDNKRSYVMDLRYAVELLPGNTTLETVADYMKDSSKEYVFNHNILLADKDDTQVLENDIYDNLRQLRNSSSVLRSGVSWNFSEAICVVNSFVMDGSFDNHALTVNSGKNAKRWGSFTTLLGDADSDGTVSPEEMRSIMSYHGGDDVCAHIYRGPDYENSDATRKNNGFIQQVYFVPETMEIKINFRPVSGPLAEPVYEDVSVNFN